MRTRILPLLLAALGGVLPGLRADEAPITIPRPTHPGAGQTFYFLLTDRFANGDPSNDRGGLAGGPEDHGFDPTRISHYHGGDFAGLIARLDYLQRLGVTAVWVTPPFVNKPVQAGSAGYHGYWVTDFLRIDPHLGTNDTFRDFVRAAHARGLKVYMDIIVNHTADVIQPADGGVAYLDRATHPLRDAAGRVVDETACAANGLGGSPAFPPLDAATSFARAPVVPAAERSVKNPAWLNDVTLYHNRGNSLFRDESSTFGDFSGLDDLMTEHPRVVTGMIELFQSWVRDFGVDGFRIDTVRHVNAEFWQAFGPALRAQARAAGRPAFLQFGEVANETLDLPFLSEFSTGMPLDAALDFGFFVAARQFVSRQGSAEALADVIHRDDWYTDHDSNIHAATTFLGNHDAGRFAYFLQQDNPGAAPERLTALVRLGHGLLYLSRGQPVVYYGDEQGMIGRGGNDMQAREDMFPAQAPAFRDAPLLATARTGADDKFDEQHPLYRFLARLGALRSAHPALRTGAMLPRGAGHPDVFAFSRIERTERIEYLAVFNNSRAEPLTVAVPTAQPAGAVFRPLFDSREDAAAPALTTDATGRVSLTLAPLAFAVWRAERPLPGAPSPLRVALVNPAPGAALSFTFREFDGHVFPNRQEVRAEVGGADFAEVTFLLERASRPGQAELLGVDDTPPYRVYWRPPADLEPGDVLTLRAHATDLRGRTAAAAVAGLRLAPADRPFGIRGAQVPRLAAGPSAAALPAGGTVQLRFAASGTPPLEYQWFHDGAAVAGAEGPALAARQPGRYVLLVRNLAGTAVSAPVVVSPAR